MGFSYIRGSFLLFWKPLPHLKFQVNYGPERCFKVGVSLCHTPVGGDTPTLKRREGPGSPYGTPSRYGVIYATLSPDLFSLSLLLCR
jgi:hypothetical protein